MDKGSLAKDFQIVILCAGYGSRIRKTTKIPKCLLRINNKSILERIIYSFEKYKIHNINIVTGFKDNLIKKHLSKYSKKIKIKYIKNKDPKKFGNTYSLFLGIMNINSNVIIVDGDLVFDDRIISKIDKKNKNEILVGDGNITDKECAKTLIDKKGYIKKTVDKRYLSIEEIKAYKFIGEAIGIIKISKKNIGKFKNYCKKFLNKRLHLRLNWEHFINHYCIKEKINFLKIEKKYKWIEIDTPNDYRKAKKIFKNR